MRVGDRAAGIAAIVFGSVVAAYAGSFPPATGQPVGPGAFPAAIGVALAAAGVLLLVNGLRQQPRDSWIDLTGWAANPQLASRAALVLAVVVLYALVLDRIGFLITATLLLSALFAAFGVRRTRILPMAVCVTLAIHVAFYTLLRVPLPWGLLEAIAW
jgi:putative tricarboxylic transport membrane protein